MVVRRGEAGATGASARETDLRDGKLTPDVTPPHQLPTETVSQSRGSENPMNKIKIDGIHALYVSEK
jgi:hypothetical protein